MKNNGIKLFLLSLLLLLLELANIRWLSGYVPMVAYFANTVLISTFFGFGLGCLHAPRGEKMPASYRFVPLILLVLFLTALVMGMAPISLSDDSGEFMWANTPGATVDLFGALNDSFNTVVGLLQRGVFSISANRRFLPVSAVVIFFFFLNAVTFYPIGLELGRLFSLLPPIRAYTVNVAGSVVGVLLMMLYSHFSLPPYVWYGTAFLIWLITGGGGSHRLWSVTAVLPLALVMMVDSNVLWSPYSKIRIDDISRTSGERRTFSIAVGEHFHQSALDFSKSPNLDTQPPIVSNYDLPFLLPDCRSDQVLVIGAGTGNDIAGAVRAGAKRVTAVEIDPVIYSLGRDHHPENPYGRGQVEVVIQDGRQFLESGSNLFDLIIYGLVDSHGLFSTYSSVRLESFLYTREGIAAGARRLRPGGYLVLSFAAIHPWMKDRIVAIVKDVFGDAALYVNKNSFIVVASTDLSKLSNGDLWGFTRVATTAPALIPTDDWPFLYLEHRSIPRHSLIFAGVILFVCWLIYRASNKGRKMPWPFFLFGAAFLMLETVAVTRLAILFGTTWAVNGFVFATILIAILAANSLVARGLIAGKTLPAVGLFFSLILLFIIPGSFFLHHSLLAGKIAACILWGLPIFCAALLFANMMNRATDAPVALGANLMGAVTGGFIEYISMVSGFSALILVAIAIYATALFMDRVAEP